MTTKTQALLELCPGAEWFIQDDIIVKWYSNTIQQPTEEEINAKILELKNAEPLRLLRQERDKKLAETDWWTIRSNDTGVSLTQEQKDYKQALRDLPSTASPKIDENGQLINVTWPTKPE